MIADYWPDEHDEQSHEALGETTGASPGATTAGQPLLSVYDVVSRSAYPEEQRCSHPFHGSETGANFMVDSGGGIFRCWRHGCTGNALHLVGIEQGVISCGDWTHDGLDTATWRAIFEAVRAAGYDLPRTETLRPEPQAVLPPAVTDRGWWRADDRHLRSDRTIDAARERTQDAIEEALRYADNTLVDVLPTTGKSHGVIAAAAKCGVPLSVFTRRGREEQYHQFRDWCDEYGLSHYTLPSFTHDCPTAAAPRLPRYRPSQPRQRGAEPAQGSTACAVGRHGNESCVPAPSHSSTNTTNRSTTNANRA